MKNIKILLVLLFLGSILYAQGSNCKVINEDIKGVYKGDCKSGLAHGSGVFTFENGMFVYKGEFLNGKMHGKGEIYSLLNNERKIVSKGSWEENVFVEEKSTKPFDVRTSRNLERNTLRKVDEGNKLFVKFFRNGNRNGITNLNVSLSSGNEMIGSSVLGYDNLTFPLRCEISYRSKNKIDTHSFVVRYVVVINEPGEWDLSLYN